MKFNLTKTLALALLLSGSCLMANADLPFRNHRFDSFKSVPVKKSSIVFFGNSITNMNEWRECFGDDPRIINRGNSGAVTQELIDNVESLIAGQPAKVFIGIGTNDLGTKGINTPEEVAARIRTIVDRFRAESPKTQVYVQSILPSNVGLRTPEIIAQTNELLKKHCLETGATYINLFDSMGGITSGELSYDRLHITAKGYKIWTDIIAPYVGVPASYPSDFEENNSGLKGSNGMRSTYWSAETVRPNDVLFIGDEIVHGGEWDELLNSPDIKDRGIIWGYGGLNLKQWVNAIPAILNTNPSRKQSPRMVILNIGLAETNGKDPIENAKADYKAVIEKIRSFAPNTHIVITSQIPRLSADHNANRVVPMNLMLMQIAKETPNAEFVDIYSPLLGEDGGANPEMVKQEYVYAKGYNRIAQALAPVVGNGAKAMSSKDFDKHYALIQAREALGKALEKAKAKGGNDKLIARANKLLRKAKPGIPAMNKLTSEIENTLK